MDRAVVRIIGRDPISKFVKIGLPQKDCPGIIEPIHNHGIFPRNEMAQDLGPRRRPDTGGAKQVFQGDRNPVEGSAVLALHDLPLRLPGLFPGQVGGDGYEGIQLRLKLLDSLEKSLGQLDGGDLLLSDQGGHFSNRQVFIVQEIHGFSCL
jgi:hypothetical protein